jgi:hypothetical protein
LLDPKEQKKHAKRHGISLSAATTTTALPDPPSWFTAELRLMWTQIVMAAPSGMLTAADHPAVVTYAMAILEHDRLARRIAARKTPAPAALTRQLRLLAVEVRAAATHLGLSIYQRSRISRPPPPPELPDNPHLRSVTLVEAGKVRGVYRVGRRK